MTTPSVLDPIELPSGERLRNRVVKAAMEEHLGEPGMVPGSRLRRLYRTWAEGGAGLILTGNVMVDARAATGPSGLALEADTPLAPFERWIAAARSTGAGVWMQINHPGRQVRADQRGLAVAPSALCIGSGWAEPRALTAAEIRTIVERFAVTAARAAACGCTGIEVHAAHGYLLSQMLSPLANRRRDRFGGAVERRARMLLEVLGAVRERLPAGTSLGVKLNTADFQRGGFDLDDAEQVVGMLDGCGIDLLELSGGDSVRPAMHGATRSSERASTRARQAYFLDVAPRLLARATMPTMLTGGIVRRSMAEEVLASGVDLVGIGTALALRPDLPSRWSDADDGPSDADIEAVAAGATQPVVRWMLRRLAEADGPHPVPPPRLALRVDAARRSRLLPRYRALVASRAKLDLV